VAKVSTAGVSGSIAGVFGTAGGTMALVASKSPSDGFKISPESEGAVIVVGFKF